MLLLVSLAPMLSTFQRSSMPWDEYLFFRFAAYQSSFWILALAAVIVGQLWCERRFVRLEQ
jgi:hypothetical protein